MRRAAGKQHRGFSIQKRTMPKKILLLPGDGIGPEVIAEAEKLMHAAWLFHTEKDHA